MGSRRNRLRNSFDSSQVKTFQFVANLTCNFHCLERSIREKVNCPFILRILNLVRYSFLPVCSSPFVYFSSFQNEFVRLYFIVIFKHHPINSNIVINCYHLFQLMNFPLPPILIQISKLYEISLSLFCLLLLLLIYFLLQEDKQNTSLIFIILFTLKGEGFQLTQIN